MFEIPLHHLGFVKVYLAKEWGNQLGLDFKRQIAEDAHLKMPMKERS